MLKLQAAFARLNDEQKAAVLHNGNTVLLAGPGSGKTAAIVIKVVHILSKEVRAPQGLLCLTYNRETVREFRKRLAEFGVHPGPSVFLGTVHSFCLNRVLRPFSALAGEASSTKRRVITERAGTVYLQRALDEEGIDQDARWFSPVLTKLRRYIACGEEEGLDPSEARVAQRYEELLAENEEIDFEGMVLGALKIIEGNEVVRDLLSAQFRWLLVDEYQDLGGPLHRIVMTLYRRAGLKVFAVGDPDQTIYPFTGASPKYLESLATEATFRTIRLKFNYRAGRNLIAASEAALASEVPRNYAADPRRTDDGEVYVLNTRGGRRGQVARIADEILPRLQRSGVPLHEIAILYRARGALVTELERALIERGIDVNVERDERLPSGEIIKWLQDCAAWSTEKAGKEERSFDELLEYLQTLSIEAGFSEAEETPLALRVRLFRALGGKWRDTTPVADWLAAFDDHVGLKGLLERGTDRPDALEDYNDLERLLTSEVMTVGEFGGRSRVLGRVVITTLHSSKGRQFAAVIIPACQEGIVPRWKWNRRRRRFEEPDPVELLDDRRLFYVGLTRARQYVFLLHSQEFMDDRGRVWQPSRFIDEIQARMGA